MLEHSDVVAYFEVETEDLNADEFSIGLAVDMPSDPSAQLGRFYPSICYSIQNWSNSAQTHSSLKSDTDQEENVYDTAFERPKSLVYGCGYDIVRRFALNLVRVSLFDCFVIFLLWWL